MNDRATNRWDRLADAALIGALALAAVRCLVIFRVDPIEGGTGLEIGPVGLMRMNLLALVPLVMAMVYRTKTSQKMAIGLLVAFLILPLLVWMIHLRLPLTLFEWSEIAPWWAGLALGLSVMHTADTPRRRKMLVGVLGGLLFALSIQAINQYVFEHARAVAMYEANPAEMLQAMGIEPGSVAQTKYETRLYQREATGALGLSNVFGSVVGALLLVVIGTAVSVSRSSASHVMKAVVILLAVLGVVALGMTHSKGAALAVLLVGGSVLGVVWITRYKPRVWLWRVMAYGLIGLVLVGLEARYEMGLPVDHTGERSLLFRALYLEAADRMIVHQPVVGVGDFGEAYLRFKNPFAPEDVSDPHNVFAMWVATFGIVGWMGVFILLAWLWRGAKSVVVDDAEVDPQATSIRRVVGCAIAVSSMIFGFQFLVSLRALMPQASNAGEQAALALFAGVMPAIGAVVMALLIVRLDRVSLHGRWLRIGLFAAAVMAIVHGQIEMNMTNHMSAPLMCVLLGAAASIPRQNQLSLFDASGKTGRYALVGMYAMLGIIICGGYFNPLTRQNELAHHRSEWNTFLDERLAEARLAYQQGDVEKMMTAIGQTEINNRITGREHRHAMRVYAEFYALFHQVRSDDRLKDAGLKHAREAFLSHAKSTAYHAPHSMANRLFMADSAWDMGERHQAAAWYERALQISENYYLDPDSQMIESDRIRAQSRIAEARESTAHP